MGGFPSLAENEAKPTPAPPFRTQRLFYKLGAEGGGQVCAFGAPYFVNMNVPVTWATGSAASPSWAMPRTKPTLLVTR